MSHSAVVLHHVPGRMRLRVPSAKGKAAILQEIRQALLPMPGIQEVAANAQIGTIVIEYDRALFPQFPRQLHDYPAARDTLTIPDPFVPPVRATESVANQSLDRSAGKLNQAIQKVTGNAVNLKELFPFSILFYAIFFVDRAINAAQWLSWAQFAFSSYMELHQSEPIAKVSASIEAMRSQMDVMHTENLQQLEAHIAGLQDAIQALSRQLDQRIGG